MKAIVSVLWGFLTTLFRCRVML